MANQFESVFRKNATIKYLEDNKQLQWSYEQEKIFNMFRPTMPLNLSQILGRTPIQKTLFVPGRTYLGNEIIGKFIF
jgi:hypothetical protein